MQQQVGRGKQKYVSAMQFYSYILQLREGTHSLIHRGGLLFQQFVVDMYAKIESERLRWIKNNQSRLRTCLYNGLEDHINNG